MAFAPDDDVVMHGDAQPLGRVDDFLRHLDVGARRRRIAWRMIVIKPRRTEASDLSDTCVPTLEGRGR